MITAPMRLSRSGTTRRPTSKKEPVTIGSTGANFFAQLKHVFTVLPLEISPETRSRKEMPTPFLSGFSYQHTTAQQGEQS